MVDTLIDDCTQKKLAKSSNFFIWVYLFVYPFATSNYWKYYWQLRFNSYEFFFQMTSSFNNKSIVRFGTTRPSCRTRGPARSSSSSTSSSTSTSPSRWLSRRRQTQALLLKRYTWKWKKLGFKVTGYPGITFFLLNSRQ